MNLASPESTRISHLPTSSISVLRRGSRGHTRNHNDSQDVMMLDDLRSPLDDGNAKKDGVPDNPHATLQHLHNDYPTSATIPSVAMNTPGSRADSRQALIASGSSRERDQEHGQPPSTFLSRTRTFLLQQAKYIGPGITMSVAYCDPGNWATDLQAGSQFGYPLLFVILLTGIFGIILQVLSLRLGIVRGKDLAMSTREWALTLGMSPADKTRWINGGEQQQQRRSSISEPRPTSSPWPNRGRWALLALLYFVAEGAIVCTELAELVGSAIALNLLFPALPLWAGVLITSLDVFLILFIYRPNTKSLRLFEFCVGCLVLVVISCLIALVVKVDPNWSDVFYGYVPSATVAQPGPLYVAIGILGATVMPHGLFLGSHFSIFEREGDDQQQQKHKQTREATLDVEGQGATHPLRRPTKWLTSVREWLAAVVPGVEREALGLPPTTTLRQQTTHDSDSDAQSDDKISVPSIAQTPRRMRRRILHSTIDVAMSMVCFAITTNSALLIVAAQAFYFGIGNDEGAHGELVVGDLFQAFDLIKSKLNHVFAILFAVALLAAGQSASITVTLAGQIISEGMIHWKTNPFLRRCITRLITIIPSLTVAAAIGKGGLDTLLVASQVALSMALPFVLLPLLLITGSQSWMRVGEQGREEQDLDSALASAPSTTTITPRKTVSVKAREMLTRLRTFNPRNLVKYSWWSREYGLEQQQQSSSAGWTYFASGWLLVATTSGMYVLIVICDVFVIATTANGSGGAA